MLRLMVFVAILAGSQAGVTTNCLHCICETESHCDPAKGCTYDVYSESCGPYQIKLPYYCDCQNISPNNCRSHEAAWKSCALNMTCATACVSSYVTRFGTHCTGGRTPTCQDYARIHNGGPKGCRKQATEKYWAIVNKCCQATTGC